MRLFKAHKTKIEQHNNAVGEAVKAFQYAIQSGDGFDAAKKLGVLENLGVSNLAFYSGLTYQLLGDEDAAVCFFEKVSPISSEYKIALLHCAVHYSTTGQYEKLHETLENPALPMSMLEKLRVRLQCLFKVKRSSMEEIITKYSPEQYESICDSNVKESPEAFFDVCCLLSNALVMVGEMINQAAIYQMSSTEVIDWERDLNFKNYLSGYNQFAYILSHAVCIPFLNAVAGEYSIGTLLLVNKSWNEKIRILTKTDYRKRVMQCAVNMCNPLLHSAMPQYLVVEHILDKISRIDPNVMAQVIDQYYDSIDQAYLAGKGSAAQYLGYVNSNILADGTDPYNLHERIKKTIGDDPQVLIHANTIKTYKSLSRKGLDALCSAETMFAKIDPQTCGILDYSTLALQYFRILEIELNEKLVVPLLKTVDFQMLKVLNEDAFNLNNGWSPHAEANYNALRTCIGYLEALLNRKKTLEIGKMQTMLYLTTVWFMQENACAQKLHSYICQCLSPAGIQAYEGLQMQKLIDGTQRDKYRNPGAHTGYLPYSIAVEAREYVLSNLPAVESWFN